MRFTNTLMTFLLSCIVAFATFSFALPLNPRDVYVPPVTYPKEGTVWKIGSHHHVTWDTSNPPAQITNRNGRVMLRKGDLTTNITLASGFDILDGKVLVEVPHVKPAHDYAVVLFGDSGNFSPQFTITH